MKYVLSKQCSFNRNKGSLIGYTNLCFQNGVWIPQYHLNVDDSLNSVYEDRMQAFCKYVKDVIVPNGYESIEYLVNRLNLKTIGLNRYQLYASTPEVNFCVRFVKNMYAKDMIYVHMFCKDWVSFEGAVQHILEKRQALYDVASPHTRKSCFHIVPSSSTAYNAQPKR